MLSLLLLQGAAFATHFTTTTIDATTDRGYYSKVALDSNNELHVVYGDLITNTVFYSSFTGTSWSAPAVVITGATSYLDIAIDTVSVPNIAHVVGWLGATEDLFYASATLSAVITWSTRTVDSSGNVGKGASIALDPQGKPHIAYHDKTNLNLNYSSYTGTGFSTYTVGATGITDGGDAGWNSAIFIEQSGIRHFIYSIFSGPNYNLAYASAAAGSAVFSTSTLDATGSTGLYIDAFASSNTLHVSYYNNTDTALRYGQMGVGGWTGQQVVNDATEGSWTGITLDPNGRQHISFYNQTNAEIKYSSYTGTAWSTHTVQTSVGASGGHTSIVVSTAGESVEITYYQSTDGTLKIATATAVAPPDATAPNASVITSLVTIANLREGEVRLEWNAPGDDGGAGNLTGTFAIQSATYTAVWSTGSAQAIISTSAVVPGTLQQFTLTGLYGAGTYYFVLWTADEVPNWSAISNISTSSIEGYEANNTTTTAAGPLTSGTTISAFIMDLGAGASDFYKTASLALGSDLSVRLSSMPANYDLYLLKPDGSLFVASINTGLADESISTQTTQTGTHYIEVRPAPTGGAFSSTQTYSLSYTATPDAGPPGAISNLTALSVSSATIRLEWSAPGDDGNSGDLKAGSIFRIKYSSVAVIRSADFEAPTSTMAVLSVDVSTGPVQVSQAQYFTLTGLLSSASYFFAIKTRDEALNLSIWNSSVDVSTVNVAASTRTLAAQDATAPSASVLTGLVTTANLREGEVRLEWTSAGDDAGAGNLLAGSEYRIQAATYTAVWSTASANAILSTSAVVPGTLQQTTLTGLYGSATFYFVLWTKDDASNWSAISNISTSSIEGYEANNTTTTAAGPLTSGTSIYAFIMDLGAGASDFYRTTSLAVGSDLSVRLSSMPANYDLYLLNPDGSLLVQSVNTGLADEIISTQTIQGGTYYIEVRPVGAFSSTGTYSLSYTVTPDSAAPAGISNLTALSVSSTTIRLEWTAPGDDGNTGNLNAGSLFRIKYSSVAVIRQADFDAPASSFAASSIDVSTGSGVVLLAQYFTVTGLLSSTSYFFAIKTRDEALNFSVWNSSFDASVNLAASTRTLIAQDATAPNASVITSLVTTINLREGEVRLEWSSPGDDGGAGNLLVGSEFRIQHASYTAVWSTASAQVVLSTSGVVPGTLQIYTVTGLIDAATRYFVLWTRDDSSNFSAISNISTSSIEGYEANNTIAGAAGPLTSGTTIFAFVMALDAGASDFYRTTSLAVGSDLSVRLSSMAANYDLFLYKPDGSLFVGSQSSETISESISTQTVQAGVHTLEVRPSTVPVNFSSTQTYSLSYTVTVDSFAPAGISNLTALSVSSTTIRLEWTAPGDDGNSGNLNAGSLFRIKYSSVAVIRSADFDAPASSFSVSSIDVSTGSGVVLLAQYFTVTGLLSSNTYFFAIKTRDEALNFSVWNSSFEATGVNTAASAMTLGEQTAPGEVTGLTAVQAGTANTIRLTWIASGDDNYAGALPAGSEYRIQWGTGSLAGITWSTASAQIVIATSAVAPGVTLTTSPFISQTTTFVYFRIWAKDEANNYSVQSAATGAFNSPFSFETVDGAGISVGSFTAIAIDRLGDLHVSYYENTNDDLRYIKRTGAAWGSPTTIDSVGSVGGHTSVAIDGSGNPHISYYDLTNADLKYAKSTDGGISFSTSTIDSAGDVGLYTSIAIDGIGNPHISYQDNTNNDLKYAKYNGASWSTSTIDSAGSVGWYTSIAIDGLGNPYISYSGGSGLKYARYDGASWSTSTIDAGNGNAVLYTSIAIDGIGNPHISYRDDTNLDLQYAKYNGASWSTSTIDSAGNAGYYTSIALDGAGNPHISYSDFDGTTYDLKYAKYNGTSWSTSTLDSAGDVGIYTSIAIDGSGNPHISYGDDTNLDLKAAHWANANFSAPMGGNAHGKVQAPTNFTNTSATVSTITWTWTQNSSNEYGFRIYKDTGAGFGLAASTNTLGVDVVTWENGGLTANTSHYGYVAAVNAGGVVTSSSTLAWTQAAVPTNATFTGIFGTSVTVNWGANGNRSSSTYELQRSTNEGTSFSIIATSAVLSFIDAGLSNTTTYYYKLRTLWDKDSTFTAFSGTSSVLTASEAIAPGEVTGLTAVQAGTANTIKLTWIASGDDNYAGALPAGSEYRIQWGTGSLAGITWSTASAQIVLSTSGIAPGVNLSTSPFISQTTTFIYFRIWAKDEANNYSVQSAATGAFNSPFSFETVDGAGISVGDLTSIATDKDGNLHVSYRDATNADLRYIKRTGAVWGSPTTVDSAGDVGSYTSIALDGAGNPHISYYDSTNGDLKYAKYNGVSWSTSTVDSAGDVGYWPSISLGGSGNAYISYYDGTNLDLKYAKYNGVSWSTQTIDSAGDVGTETSIALDGSGNAHISYKDATNFDLKYAKWTGASWSTSTVDSAGDVGIFTSIALDGSGNPHISYWDSTNTDLKYTRYNGVSWSTQTIDSAGNVGQDTSLSLDGSGNAHISYYDGTNNDLKYARYNGVSWSTSTIDSAGNVGPYTSIAIDGSGNAHISYYDITNLDLKAAHWTGAGLVAPMGGNARGKVQGPTNFTNAVVTSTTSLTWNWTDNASNEQGFRVYKDTGAGFNIATDTVTLPVNTLTWNNTGLTPNTSHHAYVAAVNVGGVVTSSASLAWTLASTPTATAITARTSTTITIDWSPAGNPEPGTDYDIQRATESGFAVITALIVTTSTRQDTGLISNTTYHFRVRARNSALVFSGFDATVSTQTDRVAGDRTWVRVLTGPASASASENWSPGGTPIAGESVFFNATSTQACTWDFTGSFSSMNVQTGYTGTITLSANVILDGQYSQADGTFNFSSNRIRLKGNIVIDGGGLGINAAGGDGFVLEGSSTQRIQGAAAVTGNIEVASSSNVILSNGRDFNNVRITSGSLEAGNLTHAVSDGWTQTGGTFTASGSTISFTGGNTSRVSILASNNFNHFQINKTSDVILQSALNILGNLTVTAGTFSPSSFTHTLTGNFTQTGGVFAPTTGTFLMNGAGPARQDVSLLQAGTFYGMTIAASTTVFVASNYLAVSGSLTLTSGTFDLATGTRTVSGPTTINSGGTLDVGSSVLNASSITVASGGTLRLPAVSPSNRIDMANGTRMEVQGILRSLQASNTLTTQLPASNRFSFEALAGSTMDVTGIQFTRLNSSGVVINSSVTFTTFDNVKFIGGGSELGINYLSASGSFTWTGHEYDVSIATNIRALSLISPGMLRMIGAVGGSSGPNREQDPNNRIFWGAPPSPSGVAGSALGISSISWTWNDGLDETGYRVRRAADGVSLSGDLAANTTQYLQGGLSTNISTSIYVEAFNPVGIATSVTVARFTLSSTPTVAPSQTFAATSSITVYWGENGNPIPPNTDYEIQRSSEGGFFITTNTIVTSTFTIQDGLLATTTHFFRVRSRNGNSIFSGFDATTISTPTLAETPVGTGFPMVGISSITGQWSPSNPAGTEVQRSTDVGFSTFTLAGTFTGTLATSTALSANSTYHFRMQGKNWAGRLTSFSAIFSTPTLASTPTASVITARSSFSITIDWSPAGNPEPGTDYDIQRATESGFAVITSVIVTTSTRQDSALSSNTTYHFRVRARNLASVFSDFDVTVNTRTLDGSAPSAVTNLAASSGTAVGEVTLTWTAVGDDGMTNPLNGAYLIERNTDTAYTAWSTATAQTTISTSSIAPGANLRDWLSLTPGTTYYFRMWARDSDLNYSPLSNAATAQAVPAGPSKTWDGGGATNLVSEAVNWVNDVAPLVGDTLIFGSTSSKNATWDSTMSTTSIGAILFEGTFGGTLTVNAFMNVTGNIVLSSTGGFTLGATSMTAGGNFLITINTFGLSINFGSTITFNGASGQNFSIQPSSNVGNIVVEGPGTVVFQKALDINGNLRQTGGTLDLSSFTHTLAGNLVQTGGTFSQTTGTISLDGAGTQDVSLLAGSALFGLTVSSANLTPSAALNVDGEFNLSAGTFTAGGFEHRFAGNLARSVGTTFTAGASTITFDGPTGTTQTIQTNWNNNAFTNIIINSSSTIQMGGSLIWNVDGNFTILQGTLAVSGGSDSISLAGNLIKSGGHLGANVDFVFDGGAQTINVTGGSGTFDTFTSSPTTSLTALSNLDIDGAFSSARGSFVTNSQTVNLAGTITLAGGTLNANPGTWIFDDIGVQNLPANSSWQNLVSANTNVQGLTAPGSTISVVNLDVRSGANLFSSAGSEILISGNWTSSGTYGSASVSSVTFNGAGAQSIWNVASSTFPYLHVNKSAVLTLFTNAVSSQNLTLSGGNLQLNGNTLSIGGSIVDGAGELLSATGSILRLFGNEGPVSIDQTGASTLEHLEIDKTGLTASSATVNALASLAVSGDFRLKNGIFSPGTANTHILSGKWEQTGGTFSATGGTIQLAGDFILNPATSTTVFAPTGGTFEFNGAAQQNVKISTAAVNAKFAEFKINNSTSVALTDSGFLTLSTVTFTSAVGILDVGNSTTTFTNGLTVPSGRRLRMKNPGATGARLQIPSGKTLTIQYGGYFDADFTTNTILKSNAGSGFGLTLSGTLTVTGLTVSGADASGMRISSAVAVNSLQNVSFKNATQNGMTVEVFAGTFTFSGMDFDATVTTNVFASSHTGAGYIAMTSATGARSGPSFEYDPNNKVYWTAPSAFSITATSGSSAIGITSITWSWGSMTDEQGVRVRRAIGSANLSGDLAVDATTWAELAIGTNTASDVYVEAFNPIGNSSTTSRQLYTLAMPPVNTAVTSITTTTISLSWNANTNPGATEFQVSRATETGFAAETLSGWFTGTSNMQTGLSGNTTYSLRVRARNGDGTVTLYDVTISSKTDPEPKYWIKQGAGGNASVGSNWSGGAAPVDGDVAVFSASGSAACTWDISPDLKKLDLASGWGGALTVSGSSVSATDFIQNGTGTLNLNGQLMQVRGNFTRNAGTFTPGAGSEVRFIGSLSQKVEGSVNPLNFENFTVASSSEVLLLQNMDISGNLLQSGIGSIFRAGNSSNTVAGNWTHNIGSGTFVAGTATFTFDGSVSQTISEADGFNHFVVNSSSAVSVSGSSIAVNGNFTLQAGTFTLSAGTMTAKGNWTQTGGGMNPTSGAVLFDGSGTQNITQLAGSNFFALISSGTGSRILQSSIDINGSFFAEAGTFLPNSQEIRLAGDLNRSGGGLSATGEIIFDGSALQNINTSISLPSLRIANTSASVRKAAAGVLDLASGVSFNLTVNSGATLDLDGNGIDLSGNLTNSGSIISVTTITFNGAGSQSWTGNSPGSFNLAVNKSAGTLSMVSTATITGDTTLTAGTWHLGSGTHTFNGPVTVNGGVLNVSSATVNLSSAATVNSGGKILMPSGAEGGRLVITPNLSLTVNGEIESSSLNNVIRSSAPATLYRILDFAATSSTANITGLTLDSVRLRIGADAALTLNNILYRNQQAGQAALLLDLATITNRTFNSHDFDTSVATNVAAPTLTSGIITMNNATGARAGPLFEYDPNGRINWTPIPATPTGFGGLVLGFSSITWSWTDNATDETGYRLRNSTGGLVGSDLAIGAQASTETALSINTSYFRYVEAFNGNGPSSSTAVTKWTFASTPTGSAFVSVSSTSITIQWSGNGNPSTTTFRVERATETNFGGAVTAAVDGPSSSSVQSGLLTSTTYYFRVRALNGDSIATAYDATLTTKTTGAPAAPTGFAGAALGISSISWTWNDVSDNETGYRVRSDTGGLIGSSLAANTISLAETGLLTNATYARYVESFNSEGASSSTSVVKWTRAAAPTATTVLSVTSSTVNVWWSANGNPSTTTYRVESATETGFASIIMTTVVDGPSTSTLQSGLGADTTFHFRVRALNGDSIASNYDATVSTQTNPPAPAAPVALTGTSLSTTSINWVWDDPATNETGYGLMSSTEANLFGDFAANTTNYTQTGLTANASSFVQHVHALNASGQSAATAVASPVYTLANPSTGTTVNAMSSNTVTLGWGINSNSTFTRWEIERSTDAFVTHFTTPVPLSSGLTANTTTFYNLLSDTTHSFRVRAYNDNATPIATALDATVSTKTNPAPPTAPTGFGHFSSSTYINWTWTDAATNETGYRAMSSTEGNISGDLAATATSWTQTLSANTSSFVTHIHAFNITGESLSATTTAAWTIANPSTGTTFSGIFASSISVSWGLSGNPGYTTFELQRSTNDQVSFEVQATSAITSYFDAGLLNGTSYAYRIRALNGVNVPTSLDVTISTFIGDTTAPSAVTNLSGLPTASSHNITLTWTAPGDEGALGTAADYLIQLSSDNFVLYTSTWNANRPVGGASGFAESEIIAGLLPTGSTFYPSYWFRIRARDESNNTAAFYTTGPVTVVNSTPAAVSWTTPAGGEFWNMNSLRALVWSGGADPESDTVNFEIDYSTTAQASWVIMVATATGASYSWTVPQVSTFTDVAASLRIRAKDLPFGTTVAGYFSTYTVVGVTITFVDSIPPAGISNLTALLGTTDGEARLNWTAPGDDGAVSPITGGLYIIKWSSVGIITNANFDSPPVSLAVSTLTISTNTVAGNAEQRPITGLVPGASYWFAIKLREDTTTLFSAWNSTADVPTVNTLAFGPAQDIAPTAPIGLTATRGSGVIDLSWTVNTEIDISHYRIYKDVTSPAVTFLTLVAGTTHQDTGLTNGVTYFYRITAVDKTNHESGFSAEVSTMPINLLPGTTIYGGTALGISSITWYWEDIFVDETGWKVFSSTGGAALSPTLTVNTSFWAETGLSVNTAYSRVVKAVNTVGDGTASTTTTRYTLANPPTALVVLETTDSNIKINWSFNGNPGGTTFRVERATDAGGAFSMITDNTASNTYNDLGLAQGTTFAYRVASYNGDNLLTAYTTPITTWTLADVTVPNAITDLLATPLSGTSIKLTWTAPGDNGTAGTATVYDIRRSTNPITTLAELSLATNIPGPVPTAYGTQQSVTIVALTEETTYYFRMVALDEVSNQSALSNLISTTTPAGGASGSISGVVTQANGTPITGVLVEALSGNTVIKSVRTLFDGSWSITGLVTDLYTIRVTWEVNSIVSSAYKAGIPTKKTGVNFTLEISYQLATLVGRLPVGVKPLASGKFAPSLAPYVELLQRGQVITKTFTDLGGTYKIPNLLPGRFQVRAFNGVQMSEEETIDLKEGQTFTFNFRFALGVKESDIVVYPNPLRNPTHTKFTIAYKATNPNHTVRMCIYNVAGERICVLSEDALDTSAAPVYRMSWDTRSESGEKVAPGMYIVIMDIATQDQTEKVRFKAPMAILR